MKFEMRQNVVEFRRLIDYAKLERVSSYLEIGCRFGGSLWAMGSVLPIGARIVGVDMPYDDEGRVSLERCVSILKERRYDVHLMIGKSDDPEIVAAVDGLGPFDLLFIDGGHEPETAIADWNNYGSMAKMVAFHDITPRNFDPQIEVPAIWDRIKKDFEYVEIRDEVRGYGIGILWR